jgi:hypothetical protein
MVILADPSPRQIMQMQQCRAAARSPSFSISLKDFAERFAIWSPAFWLRALMESTDTTPASFAGFETMASAMFSKPVGPLGMLIQGMDTCLPGQYLTLGCFMRYCFRPSVCRQCQQVRTRAISSARGMGRSICKELES